MDKISISDHPGGIAYNTLSVSLAFGNVNKNVTAQMKVTEIIFLSAVVVDAGRKTLGAQ